MCYTAGQLAKENLYRHETDKCKPHHLVCFSFFRVDEKYFFSFNFSWHLQWPSDLSLHGLHSLSCAYGRLFAHQQKFLQVRANSVVCPQIEWKIYLSHILFQFLDTLQQSFARRPQRWTLSFTFSWWTVLGRISSKFWACCALAAREPAMLLLQMQSQKQEPTPSLGR